MNFKKSLLGTYVVHTRLKLPLRNKHNKTFPHDKFSPFNGIKISMVSYLFELKQLLYLSDFLPEIWIE